MFPGATRQALSNGAIRFSIAQKMTRQISKYSSFLLKLWHHIPVKPADIRLGKCSKRSNERSKYNSTSSIEWHT